MVAAPGLKRIALLSEHGASKGGGGKTSEEYLKSVAESKGFEWSIARGGLLKVRLEGQGCGCWSGWSVFLFGYSCHHDG